jgi:hypothetical protein
MVEGIYFLKPACMHALAGKCLRTEPARSLLNLVRITELQNAAIEAEADQNIRCSSLHPAAGKELHKNQAKKDNTSAAEMRIQE